MPPSQELKENMDFDGSAQLEKVFKELETTRAAVKVALGYTTGSAPTRRRTTLEFFGKLNVPKTEYPEVFNRFPVAVKTHFNDILISKQLESKQWSEMAKVMETGTGRLEQGRALWEDDWHLHEGHGGAWRGCLQECRLATHERSPGGCSLFTWWCEEGHACHCCCSRLQAFRWVHHSGGTTCSCDGHPNPTWIQGSCIAAGLVKPWSRWQRRARSSSLLALMQSQAWPSALSFSRASSAGMLWVTSWNMERTSRLRSWRWQRMDRIQPQMPRVQEKIVRLSQPMTSPIWWRPLLRRFQSWFPCVMRLFLATLFLDLYFNFYLCSFTLFQLRFVLFHPRVLEI